MMPETQTEASNASGASRLTNAQWESFAQNVAKGMSYYSAYCAAGFSAKNRNSADVCASRLANRPTVAERISWLKCRAATDGRMSREEKLEALELVIRTGSPADKVKAVALHNEVQGDGEPMARAVAELTPDQAMDYSDRLRVATQARLRASNAVKLEVITGTAQERYEGPEDGAIQFLADFLKEKGTSASVPDP